MAGAIAGTFPVSQAPMVSGLGSEEGGTKSDIVSQQ